MTLIRHISSLVLVVGMLTACNTTDNSAFVGRWKLYQVRYAGKDISKSSDPGFKNGIAFGKDGAYLQFGNEGYRDTGTYRLEAERIFIYAQQDTLWGTYDLSGDTLQMRFPLQGEESLDLALYRLGVHTTATVETGPEPQSSD